jgi:hypothetical protein
MPRRVMVNGVVHTFPDDATDDEVSRALSADARVSKPQMTSGRGTGYDPNRSWGDMLTSLLNALPMVGGTVGGIVGGVPGAALGGAAGEGYRQAATHAAEIPEALADVARNAVEQPGATLRGAIGGGTAGTVGAAKEGAVNAAAEVGGRVANKYVVQPVARAVMRGYIKPSLAAANIEHAREIVQTALDEALPVTAGGDARAERLITELNADINSTLARVKGKISLPDVAKRVRAFAKAKYFKPGVDSADYQAALEVADAIDRHAALNLPNGARVTGVNAVAANDIKQAVRPPSRAYGQQSYVPETTTRKVAGAEMRKEIERTAAREGATEVAAKNAREGRLIDTQDAIKRAAGREENKGLNPTAVPNILAGAYGAEDYRRHGDPAEAAVKALAARMFLSPAVMTRAVIYANKLAAKGWPAAAAARAAITAVTSGKEEDREHVPQD